jgi:triosephosphate isomerase
MNYLIANWKAQMTLPLITEWMKDFRALIEQDDHVSKALTDKIFEIIICPPSPFTLYLKKHVGDIPGISIGSQSLSPKGNGKYTGEITAEALRDVVNYSIIGHSERRSHFHESEEIIHNQIDQAQKNGIKQILCVRNTQDQIYESVDMVAYEPVEAIGTGANATVDDVLEMKKQLALTADVSFFYGGSVDDTNMKGYLDTGEINGFLVGTASLKAESFFAMTTKMI